MADYNSYSWTYEAVCYRRDGVRVSSGPVEDEAVARIYYDEMKIKDVGTVLFCHSRLGVVRGTPGL